MFRRLIAALLIAAPSAASIAQVDSQAEAQADTRTQGDAWGIAAMPNGCMIQATSPQGTMLSVWGFAGDSKLGFLLQNRGWNGALQDGRHYALSLDFAGQQGQLVQATARENIDSDGPGFFFTVEPGKSEGTGFLRKFTTAQGMTINRDGRSVDTLPLRGSRTAMAAFAQCLSAHWQVPVAGAASDSDDKGDDDGSNAPSTI